MARYSRLRTRQPTGIAKLDAGYAASCTVAIRGNTWAVNQVFDDVSGTFLAITPRTASGSDGGQFLDAKHGAYFRTDHSTFGPYYGGRVVLKTNVAERFATGKLTLLLVTNREATPKQQAIFSNPTGFPVSAGNLAWQWWDDNRHYIDVGNETQRVMLTDPTTGPATYLLSWDNASKRKRLIRDGVVLVDETADTDSIAASITACQALCNGVGTYFFAAFDTVFSAGAEAALTVNPWQVYAPQASWWPQGTPVVAPTLSAAQIAFFTSTTARPRVTLTF